MDNTKRNPLRVMQVNTDNSRPSLDIVLHTANRLKVDIICISEPPKAFKGKIGCPGWHEHLGGRAAILTSKKVQVKEEWTGPCTVGVVVGETRVIATYHSPNEDNELYLGMLVPHIEEDSALVLTGDLNCRWPEFDGHLGMRQRDIACYDFIIGHDLKVENDGTPTCTHQGRETTNDYTLTKRANISGWRVCKEDSLSDHRLVYFEVVSETGVQKTQEKKKMDEGILRELLGTTPQLRECISAQDAAANADAITKWLSEAVDKSTVTTEYRSYTYWWNEMLEKQRLELKKLTRKIERCKMEARLIELKDKRRQLRQQYRYNIGKEKEASWRKFISKDKPWGKPYKIIVKNPEQNNTGPPTQVKRPDGVLTSSRAETEAVLLQSKFPRVPAGTEDIAQPGPSEKNMEYSVTVEELTNIIKKLNNRSAPGLDGINHKTLKIVNMIHPTLLTRILNECIQWAIFPEKWKHGKLVLVYKGKGDKLEADSYRPLTMLPTLGKLLERCISTRISEITEGNISNNQYGFRRGRSCEDCILAATKSMDKMKSGIGETAVVSLDIKGAFDHTLWMWIIKELERMKVPEHLVNIIRDYFNGRKVFLGESSIKIERGCPQGSVVGPLLWNVSYNYILENLERRLIKSYAYADDTLMLISAGNMKELYMKIRHQVDLVETEMAKGGLSLNVNKTEIMLLKKRRHVATPPVALRGLMVQPKSVMKYLGVWLDDRLSWEPHLKKVYEKGIKLIPKIAAIARNTYGYSNSARRTMLEGTVGSYLIYGSAAFAHRLTCKYVARYVDKLHRSMLLCYGRLYRTVSYLPATVICDWVPMKYIISARAIRYSMKKKVALHGVTLLKPVPVIDDDVDVWSLLGPQALKKWEDEYKNCRKGEWTRRMIGGPGQVRFEPCFWLNQALSGHGVFGSYLKKMARRETAGCMCGFEEESPEHIFLYCPLFKEGRPEELSVGDMETIVYLRDTVKKLWENERLTKRRLTEM